MTWGFLHAGGAKRKSLAMTFNGIGIGKQVAITQRAMIVACYIADSVDIVSKLHAVLHFLHVIQLAWQRSANEELNTDAAIAAMDHAFITKAKSILGS